jgi:hypothetical protein
MSSGKKLYLSVMVLVITALYICFIALDFSRFNGLDYYYGYYTSAVLKRITVLLAAVVAWTMGKDRLSSEDGNIMKVVFFIICSAEVVFLFGRFIIGMVLYGVCQSFLIIRNGRGLLNKLKYADNGKRICIKTIGLLIIIAVVLMTTMTCKTLGINTMVIAAWIYGTVLSISLWTGFVCKVLDLLPRKNSDMVAAGMFCFYCCDILVGLDAVMKVSFTWLIVNSFIWVFFTPAVTLLALSSYKL